MKHITLITIAIMLLSCKQDPKPAAPAPVRKTHPSVYNNPLVAGNEAGIRFIEGFYRAYITDCLTNADRKIDLSRYCTSRLLEKLRNAEIDYDPFINAQDCDTEWLEHLVVTPDKVPNRFSVTYPDAFNKTNIVVKLELTEENGNYRIDKLGALDEL